MSDDWRVLVTGAGATGTRQLVERLRSGELEHRLATAAGERVVVSFDDDKLFLYAGTREQATAAADAVRELALSAGLTAATELRHWHPVAEQWEDPDAPLPQAREQLTGELAQLAASEDEQSNLLGYAEFEVRVQLPSHHATLEFAQALQARGLPYVRRWHYVLVGADDEVAAKHLAEELAPLAPDGSNVTVEGSAKAAEADLPPNPFAVFGGLGG